MKATKNKIAKALQILYNESFYCAVFISAGCGFLNYFGNKEKIQKIKSGQSRENLMYSATDNNISDSSQDNLFLTKNTKDIYGPEGKDIEDKYGMQKPLAEPKKKPMIPNTKTTQKDNDSTKKSHFLATNDNATSINKSVTPNQSVSSNKIENRKDQNITRKSSIDYGNQKMVQKNKVHSESINHTESLDNIETKPKQDVLKVLDQKINYIKAIINWINNNKKDLKKNHNAIWKDIQNAKLKDLLINLESVNKQLNKEGMFKDIREDLNIADEYIRFLSGCIKHTKEKKK